MDAHASRVLLAEPASLVRRTVAGVARQLGLAHVEEASTVQAAEKRMQAERFGGVVIALDDDGVALRVIEALRRGDYPSSREVPVMVLSAGCDEATVLQLKQLAVCRVVLTPFKIKTLLDAITALTAVRPAAA